MTEPVRRSGEEGGRDIDRLEIALRVTADDLDPERITRMLGVTPTFAARKGEDVDRGGVPVTQRTGTWSYELKTMPLMNKTLMTEEERAELAAWVDQGAPTQ